MDSSHFSFQKNLQPWKNYSIQNSHLKKWGRGGKTGTEPHTYLFVLPQKLPILAENTLLIISCGGELEENKKGGRNAFLIKKPYHHSISHN